MVSTPLVESPTGHPAGTRVHVQRGEALVENLRNGDAVIGWSSHPQKKRVSRPVRVGVRNYCGPLLAISATSWTVRVPPSFPMLVRWSEEAPATHVSYLLWTPDAGFQVGSCIVGGASLGRVPAALRGRLAPSSRLWILAAHASSADAAAYKDLVAEMRALPEHGFQASPRRNKRVKANHDAGIACLGRHGREFDLPLVSGTDRDHDAREFVTGATNVLANLMSLPLLHAQHPWGDVRVVETTMHDAPLYSLEVDGGQGYIVNGILVGASSDSEHPSDARSPTGPQDDVESASPSGPRRARTKASRSTGGPGRPARLPSGQRGHRPPAQAE